MQTCCNEMLTDILNPDWIQNQINDLGNMLFIILTHRLADRNRILPCLFLICRQAGNVVSFPPLCYTDIVKN